jgi:hypothetical protein
LTGRRLALIGCPLLAIILYLPTLGHAFVFDDRGIIEQNPLMHDVRDLPRLVVSPYWNLKSGEGSLYRPLTTFSFALDRLIARGLHAWWYHLVNVLLHGLVTLLFTLVALEILPGLLPGALAGLAFAVHPVHVEAVAAVVGRSELLAAAAVLAALLFHRRALAWGGRRYVVGAWSAVFLAVMAKESGAAAAFVCIAADLTFPVESVRPGRRATLYAGYGAALLGALLLRSLVLGSIGVGQPIPFVDNPAAAAGFPVGRLTALGTVVRYAGLLLWPRHLSADYSFDQIPMIRGLVDATSAGRRLLSSVRRNQRRTDIEPHRFHRYAARRAADVSPQRRILSSAGSGDRDAPIPFPLAADRRSGRAADRSRGGEGGPADSGLEG